MHRFLAAAAFLMLLLPAVHACAWLERADIHVLSQNAQPIEGATVRVTYQRNAADIYDTTAVVKTDTNGFVSYRMCDDAPYGILYKYNITVSEPYHGGVKFLPQEYDVSKGGINTLYFVYLFDLYNLSINVKNRSGLPAARAPVTVTGMGLSKIISTSKNGSAWVVLPPGAYQVSAEFDDANVTKPVSWLNYSRSITLVQPPLTNNTLTVNLRDETGQPLENLTVLLEVGGAAPLETSSNASGTAKISEIRVFSARLEIRKGNTTLYSAPVQLLNLTTRNITFDIHPPEIADVNATYRNVGNETNAAYEITVSANITDAGGREGLRAQLLYDITEGQPLSSEMGPSDGNFSAVLAFQNISAPFEFAYTINATDSAGNSRLSSRTVMRVESVPPVSIATPTPPTPPPPTPTPSKGPFDDLLGPLVTILESVSTYMWVLIILVLVILGGTVFVFLAVNAFFYMKGKKPSKP